MASTDDRKPLEDPMPGPPGSWRPARGLARRALAPVERFLAIEAASGILLLLAAVVALVWANSPWQGTYEALWHSPLGLRLGPFAFERDLHFWINDGVMTIFFFVVGLEIRREIHGGELSDLRRAALPLAAALGGMLVPAGLYVAFNRGHGSSAGWGIPMATDIAFAVGVLALLGSRVPPALRVLLLTLAVIDDVGAIIVIAFFYSSGIALSGFLVIGAGIAMILLFQTIGIRSPWAYVPAGIVTWAGAYLAGIHPTLAGVVIGLMTPVRAWYSPRRLVERARMSIEALGAWESADEREMLPHLERLDVARREAVSPLERIQHRLHGWVAFGAMPLFALANAGVTFGNASFDGEQRLPLLGIVVGLIAGKPLGILGVSWLATRVGLARLPRGITWPQVAVVGVVAGIGFTMSIFIAQLAFPSGANLETSKMAVLLASGFAAILANGLGHLVLPPGRHDGAAAGVAQAEPSKET